VSNILNCVIGDNKFLAYGEYGKALAELGVLRIYAAFKASTGLLRVKLDNRSFVPQ
jgi:hypothetical protein